MRVLVVHNRYRSSSPSGEDRVVDQEHDVLVSAGHDVRRFERHSDEIAGFPALKKAAVPVQVVWNPFAARDLDRLITTFRPDVVHVHNVAPLISPSILRTCDRRRVPVVVTFHNFRPLCPTGTLFRAGAPCHDCVGRRLPVPAVAHGCYRGSSLATVPPALSNAAHRHRWQASPSAYIFISEAQRRELGPASFPATRSFVKPNLVLPVPPRERAEALVVYLGRLTEEKGLHLLMRAWDRHLADRPASGLRLAIAGTGPLEAEVRSWAGGRPSVAALGLLDRDACTDLVRRARVVVVPSEWPEPFGLVVAEAMAAAVAPVATAHGAFTELITDEVDGILFPPGDATALASVLGHIDEAPAWADGLGAAARVTYERRFEPSRNVAELERIYRFAVEHPRWREAASTAVSSDRTTPT